MLTVVRHCFRFIHRQIRQAVRILVQLAADVLERDLSNLMGEQARPRMEGLEAVVLHLIHPAHLLHHQQRIRLDVDRSGLVLGAPVEGGHQAVVLGDIVRRMGQRPEQLCQHVARRVAHDGAPAGGTRVAAGAAIHMDRECRGGHAGRRIVHGRGACALGSATGTTKNRIRWQLSHCTIVSLRRTCWAMCGRCRT
jgi:hypothetical protein